MAQGTYTNFPDEILRLVLESKISKPALKLYIYLRMHKNNKSGLAWPSVRRIAKEAHIDKGIIKSARDELISLGIIFVQDQPEGRNMIVGFNDDEVHLTVKSTTVLDSNERGALDSNGPTIKNTNTNLKVRTYEQDFSLH